MKEKDPSLSYQRLHDINNRAPPERFTVYKHALLLFKLYNGGPGREWCHLNDQHLFSRRSDVFAVARSNILRVGNNILVNRLATLNNKVPLEWLNLSFNSYKIKAKTAFLN